jgi:hypothetical protein
MIFRILKLTAVLAGLSGLAQPVFAQANPFKGSPTPAAAPVAPLVPVDMGVPGHAAPRGGQGAHSPQGTPSPVGMTGITPAGSPSGIAAFPSQGAPVPPPDAKKPSTVPEPELWSESITATRIGKVNNLHVFRGQGAYLFEEPRAYKVSRKLVLPVAPGATGAMAGLPPSIPVPGDMTYGGNPANLPSMVGRPVPYSAPAAAPAMPPRTVPATPTPRPTNMTARPTAPAPQGGVAGSPMGTPRVFPSTVATPSTSTQPAPK